MATETTTGDAIARDIADPALAPDGVQHIEWSAREMPVMRHIRGEACAWPPACT